MIQYLLDKIFPKKEICNHVGDTYMHRWYVFKSKWFSVFIHKFVRSDFDRALHDHPWPFIVIPIWRGYIEHYQPIVGGTRFNCQRVVYPIFGTRYRKATFRHRVELHTRFEDIALQYGGSVMIPFMQPAWSIFIHFKRRRSWGFWCPKGFELHKDGVKPCE